MQFHRTSVNMGGEFGPTNQNAGIVCVRWPWIHPDPGPCMPTRRITL